MYFLIMDSLIDIIMPTEVSVNTFFNDGPLVFI